MAVTRVQLSEGSSATTAAFVSAPTAGNLLILAIACQNGSSATNSVSTPTGWTAGPAVQASSGSSRAFVALFWKIAAGSDADPTFTITGSNTRFTILTEWSGLAASSAVDITFPTATGIGSGDYVAGPGTTGNANDFIYAAAGGRSVAGQIWGGGQSSDDQGSASSAQLFTSTQTVSATGSYSPTFHMSAGVVALVAIAFKQAGSPTTQTRSATLNATATLSAARTRSATRSTGLTATATLSSSRVRKAARTVGLNAAATLDSFASTAKLAASTLNAVATLATTRVRAAARTVALNAVATLAAAPVPGRVRTALLNAVATLDATPTVVTTDVTLELPVLNINLTLPSMDVTLDVRLGLPVLNVRVGLPGLRMAREDGTAPKPLDTVIGHLYAMNGITYLARLDNIDATAWREVVSGKGQASFQVPLDDASTALITDRSVVKLAWVRDGQIVAKFACRIRAEGSKVKQLAVDGRRWVRFENMPGCLDFLSDAVVYPEQPLDTTDVTTRWFGFMSTRDSDAIGGEDWYVPSEWHTPVGLAWSDTGGTFRDKLPKDFRGVDTTAEWISSIGTLTTQPEFNFNYYRATLTLDPSEVGSIEAEILYTVDNFLWLYLNGELIANVPPPGRGQWRNGYTVNVHLNAGDNLFAARVQNSRFSLVQGANPIALIMAVRALNADGSINRDLGDNGLIFHTAQGDGVVGVLPGGQTDSNWHAHGDNPEPGWRRAQVLHALIMEAKQRVIDLEDATPNGLANLRVGFSGEYDSLGRPWTDRGQYELDVGTSDLSVIAEKLTERDMDVWMDPDDMSLMAYTRMGADRSGSVRLRYGWDPDQPGTILEAEIDVKGVQYNSILTQLPIIRWLRTDEAGSIEQVGRVEAGFNAAPLGTLGSGGFVARQLLNEGSAQLSALTVKTSILEGQLPYIDYQLGDTITCPGRRGLATSHRALAFNVVGPTKDEPKMQVWAELFQDQTSG